MATIRNTASMRLKGRVGNTTYYSQGGRMLARVSQNSTNWGDSARRSLAQQQRRVKWSNLVSFYKISENWIHGAFEGKKATQSDYNKFMSVNLPAARVALTKDMAAVNACVLDEFIISQGTLKSFDITRSEDEVNTNLLLSSTFWEENVTVAKLSQGLLWNNTYLTAGMQITLVVYEQIIDSFLNPKVLMTRHEMTLDTTDTRPAQSLFGAYPLTNKNHRLYIGGIDAEVYCALILSDSTSGTLKVSTQRLVKGDDAMAIEYSDAAHVQAAVNSYGVDPTRFLDSGDE